MSTPIILYRNLFRTTGAVITSSGTDTGFSAGDVGDHRAYKGWQGNVLTSTQWINIDCLAAKSADSILLVNHNMVANAGQVKIYANTVDPPTGNTVQAAYSPTSDVADYKAFGTQSFRYWRVEFIDPAPPFTTKPFMGEILLGQKLDLGNPYYVSPDIDPRLHDIQVKSQRSEGGHFLGAVLQGIIRRGTLRFGGDGGVDRAKFTSDLNDFLQTHYRKCLPWGLVFDSADSEFASARWLKKPDEARTPSMPIGGSYSNFTFDLPFEEAWQEAA